ncbi:MAG TPA: hypothetical protein VKZ78_05550, partial [Sphingobacteriaceae bacterium]|nr:hypothetical protein [Sphingobacteriaceae bacterium]
MIKQFILTIGWLFFVLCAWAQAPLRLTLQESIKIASDSSLQSFRTKNLYMASYWQYRTFQAARLPSLTLNMNPLQYSRDFTRRYDLENNVDIYRTQQSLYSSGNLSIHQNLDATGGIFFIDSELGFLRSIGGT